MTEITDLLRRTLLFGIGAISLTTDRVQEFVNDLVERGEITSDQASSMVSELTKRGSEARKQFRETVKTEIQKAFDGANIPSKTDLKRIEAKIDRLILMQGPHAEAHIEGETLGGASAETL